MTQIFWLKCQGEVWCKLHGVNLEHPHFQGMTGVVVIWHGAPNPHTVQVATGIVSEVIAAARQNPAINLYRANGLFVTWAGRPASQQMSIAAYLSARLTPLVPQPQLNWMPQVEVNLPW